MINLRSHDFLLWGSRLLIVWLLLALVFFFGVYLSGFINGDRFTSNAYSSLSRIEQEGEFPRYPLKGDYFQKDNHSDAIMISAAVCRLEGLSPMERSLMIPYSTKDSEGIPPAAASTKQHSENDVFHHTFYGRYWHGYLVVLRPFLYFTDLRGIRIFNYILFSLLTIGVFILTFKKLGIAPALIYILSLLSVGIPLVPHTLQFNTCFILMSMASLAVLFLPKNYLLRDSRMSIFFFVVGALTSFFDLFSTPLVTFAFPMVFAVLRRHREPDLKFFVICGILWIGGYLGLWATKWLIADLLIGASVFNSGLASVSYHSGLVLGSSDMGNKFALIVGIMAVIAVIIYLISHYIGTKRGQARRGLVFILIALLPEIWIFAIQNHSLWHRWEVWRILSVYIFSLGTFFLYILTHNKKTEYH